jgi:excisionase family DNA binding protein
MTVRLALTLPERDERSITVATAAERLGCDQTTIRELLRKGLLAGVRIGKSEKPSGVRVKLWSVQDWEARHAIGGVEYGDEVKRQSVPRPRHNVAHEEAMVRLKAWGV